jgi:hypothetical protein
MLIGTFDKQEISENKGDQQESRYPLREVDYVRGNYMRELTKGTCCGPFSRALKRSQQALACSAHRRKILINMTTLLSIPRVTPVAGRHATNQSRKSVSTGNS